MTNFSRMHLLTPAQETARRVEANSFGPVVRVSDEALDFWGQFYWKNEKNGLGKISFIRFLSDPIGYTARCLTGANSFYPQACLPLIWILEDEFQFGKEPGSEPY